MESTGLEVDTKTMIYILRELSGKIVKELPTSYLMLLLMDPGEEFLISLAFSFKPEENLIAPMNFTQSDSSILLLTQLKVLLHRTM